MSRIGNNPVAVPEGVTVDVKDSVKLQLKVNWEN